MGPLDFLFHLLNFVAPAVGVSVVLTLANALLVRAEGRAGAFWRRFLINFVTGSLVLAAALMLFGRDGKMMAYLALVLATASSEWWLTRAPRKKRPG
jgi:K+-transporting ATPase A subunit